MRRLLAICMVGLAASALAIWFYGWAVVSCHGAEERGDTCIDLGMADVADQPASATLPISR
jgi:hypothetical protein